ncbi:MAG TPA: poly-gamma-glutamate hydrolase family protein [Staphylococcus sp.]|nr:poly-gamma-glutamate hydrolase family protein [Staphylococcus sp.]
MVDQFKSMTELMTYTSESVDWEIHTRQTEQPVIITAVHGGAIERGTTELAQAISESGNYNYYTFKGVRRNKNNELHVTSRHFDEPKLMQMVNDNRYAISVHGCMGDKPEVYIGGKDQKLIHHIKSQLSKIDVAAKDAPAHISGIHDDNFVNCCQHKAGVQLELTARLRKDLFKNKKYNLNDRENRGNWSYLMDSFSNAIVLALKNYQNENYMDT